MKKKVLLLAVLFMSLNTNAQIKDVTNEAEAVVIGKVTFLGDLAAKLYKIEKSDSYFITYKDVKFTTLTSIKSFTIGNK